MSVDTGDYSLWFEQQYKHSSMRIPASFTVIIPSKDRGGKKILPSEEVDKILKSTKKLFGQHFGGLTIIKGQGYWSGIKGPSEEAVQIVEAYGVFSRDQIHRLTWATISLGFEILTVLKQEAVLVKSLEYPFLIKSPD